MSHDEYDRNYARYLNWRNEQIKSANNMASRGFLSGYFSWIDDRYPTVPSPPARPPVTPDPYVWRPPKPPRPLPDEFGLEPATVRSEVPVLAWKGLEFIPGRGLRSWFRPEVWPEFEPYAASCKKQWGKSPHQPPCNCGIHSVMTLGPTFPYLRRNMNFSCLVRVWLWGKLIVNEKGYRAQYAYPESIILFHHGTTCGVGFDAVPYEDQLRIKYHAEAAGRMYGVDAYYSRVSVLHVAYIDRIVDEDLTELFDTQSRFSEKLVKVNEATERFDYGNG